MKMLFSGSLVAMSFASVCVLAGCHSAQSPSATVAQAAEARTVESRRQEVPVMVRVTGTVHAHESAAIAARVMGSIEQVLVRAGDTVRSGQSLVMLDQATQRAALAQAQASVIAAQNQQAVAQSDAALAASTLERYKKLQSQKSVSLQEMDEVMRRSEAAATRADALRALTEAAKAQEINARASLGYAQLRAPFAGVVTARLADPGTMAAPGVPILQIDSTGPLELQVNVDESLLGSIRKGISVPVSLNGSAEGIISEILPAADAASHSFLVKIALSPSSQLHAGMYGTAQIATGKRSAILVPRSAVVQRGSLSVVYALDSGNVAQLRVVTVGAQSGENVEVLSGLSDHEKLVDQPGDRDLAGKRIEARP